MTTIITAVPLLGGREPDRSEPARLPKRAVRHWECTFRTKLTLVDLLAGVVGGTTGYLLRPGGDADTWDGSRYALVAAVTPLAWAAVLSAVAGRDPRRLGNGRAHARDVMLAALTLLAAVGLLTWVTAVAVPRGSVLVTLAVAAGATLAGRAGLRLDLRRRRARGECQQRVLAVGRTASVDALVQRLRRDRDRMARVVGCCVPGLTPDDAAFYVGGVPVVGGLEDVVSAVGVVDADTVAVLPCPELETLDLRRLTWALEELAPRFVMIPGLVDIAGPRLAVGPVGDLLAVHVRPSRLAGPGWLVKGFLDRFVALVLLVVLAPVMGAIALLVRLTSPGPALFRQTRIGLDGREFTFLKFRTMYQGAELRRPELRVLNINHDGLLFKIRDDPRVTRVGRVLRRWSLDELPQLINVLAGDMSLVGPRPPLPEEVAAYGTYAWRRLAVKPGLTGLWQTSGRSDLSWEDSVRLDLHYVDNWSLALDAVVLWRTLPAVLNRTGAY
jgi:exopolysaccharide biosynthesis polyprenyl glycosylphosphotransferase